MSAVYEWCSGYSLMPMSLVMSLMSDVYESCCGYRLMPMPFLM